MPKLAVPKKSCVTERHRSHSGLMVVCFSRSMNGSGIEPEQLAELAQEFRRRVQADRRLQIGPLQRLAQHAAEFAVHADVDVGIDQLGHIGKMAAEREHHVDFGADAFDQPADLGEIGRHVEGAVDRADDVDPRLLAFLARLALGDLLAAVLRPQPGDGAVGALPLIFVDGARQEALDVGAFGRDAAADHLGDRAGDDDGRQRGSSVVCARFIAPSVPFWPSSSSPSPVTTIGNSCGGSASV